MFRHKDNLKLIIEKLESQFLSIVQGHKQLIGLALVSESQLMDNFYDWDILA